MSKIISGYTKRKMSMTSSDSRASVNHCNRVGIQTAQEDDVDVTDNVDESTDDPCVSNEDEKVISIHWRGGFLGISVYNIDSEDLLVYQDVPDFAPDFSFLKMTLLEVSPRAVVRSLKEDDNVIDILKQFIDTNSGSPDETSSGTPISTQISRDTTRNRVNLEILPNRAFGLEQARSRLLQLRLGDSDSTTGEGQLNISSILPQLIPSSDLPCVSLQAAGALVFLLDRWRNSKNIERAMEGKRYRIGSVRTVALHPLLRVDPDTLKGLRIFVQDCHPSAYKSNFVKEGFSLFEAMNKCKSSVGSSMLRSLFMRPTRDVEELEQRFSAIKFLSNPANDDVLTTLCEALQRVKKINRILSRLEYCNLSIQEWTTLFQTTSSLATIVHLAQKLPQDIGIFEKLGKIGISNDPYRVARAIQYIIDFDKSKELEQFTVKPGIDANLDELRRKYSELPGLLSKVNVEEAKSLPFRTECALVYYPEIGFLLGIPRPSTCPDSPSSLTIQGYQFMFTANNKAFYKSARCKELDESIGDIHLFILDLETRLCKKLCGAVQEHASILVNAVNYAALLDCYVSLALSAREYHMVKPTFVCPGQGKELSFLRIVEGRNLLQELSLDSFVPNDTSMGDTSSRMHVIMGPNASGKSVYINQVGMLVFLAHIGSYVPALEMSLTPFYGIFTRLCTIDSPSTGLSSFAKDLNQVSYALRCANSESLVLIDEFGIGTSDIDGQSILSASLNHWIRLEPSPPLVIAATHFHGIGSILEPSSNLSFKSMDFLEASGELVALFKIVDGVRGSSHAKAIAMKMGIPADVLQRSEEVAVALGTGSSISVLPDGQLDSVMERIDEMVRAAFEVQQDTFSAFVSALLESEAELNTRRAVSATPKTGNKRGLKPNSATQMT